ncbi:lactate utilization protein [Desulfolutivibrio sulfoxidireducens]|uniref:lactate utilization protein n=1 Tax=Desulfolutivibrio sulfoxidireducens TaxID=2773299 RepID=UPI00159E55AA|nr:lactate utilization protein [Desulfolutivibrio sulfoxidireducens]QLA17098.1 lactate utilization protein [Desulfolutivibrio sulfoxidireducens]
MERPIEAFHAKRRQAVRKALEGNHFAVYEAPDSSAAAALVLTEIIPETGAKSFSFGGSGTVAALGLVAALRANPDYRVLDTTDKSLSREAMYELRRQALLVDCFLTGTNAVTESGQLVNLDMIGNRVGAMHFGPKQVIVLAGRNKIVPGVEEAMRRIKAYTAPVNAMRLDKKTPCVKTSFCQDCNSPDRICNVWTVTEKSFPAGRVKIVLIDQDLGI